MNAPIDRPKPGAASKPANAALSRRTTPGEFIRQVRTEADKVVWPTRQETITTALFVALLMTTLGVFFLGIDWLFGHAVQFLLSLAS